MMRRILLVRAVNVGGAKLPMAEFRELLGELGGSAVRTYIASGNAIVDVPGDAEAFDRKVERALQERYGWFREVTSRTPAEVEEALAAHPFEMFETKFSYIMFLTEEPTTEAIAAAREVDTGDDLWDIVGREVHLRYTNGAGKANPGIDKALRRLKSPGTARNVNTVRTLIELATTS